MTELDDELDRIRRRAATAAAKASAEGRDPLLAAIDEAMKATLPDARSNLPRLAAALGTEIDAGAFLMGMLSAAFVIQGVDVIEMVRRVPWAKDLILVYMEKARREAGQ